MKVRGMVGRLPVISMPMMSDERWQELTRQPVTINCKVDSRSTSDASQQKQYSSFIVLSDIITNFLGGAPRNLQNQERIDKMSLKKQCAQ